jgi:PTH1 family peptidyl-tRNA hydrolase
MKLIVGLGNPGIKFENTRHNVGFMVIGELSERFGVVGYEFSKSGNAEYAWANIKSEKIELFKPLGFMNNSGTSVKYAYKKHPELKITDIYVIHDDLDIKLGQYRIQFGKGPKVHNGLLSIYEKLGTKNFWHVRIGIDNRHSEVVKNTSRGPVRCENRHLTGEEYVLQEFGEEEKTILNEAIKKVTEDLMKRLFDFQPK